MTRSWSKWNRVGILLLALSLLLAACGQDAAPTALPPTEAAQAPSATLPPPSDTPPPPSDTPEPTATPDLVATQVAVEQAAAATLTAEAPTATDTPLPPTDTPQPTETPEPTATSTAVPTEAASPVPEASNTPQPPAKPKTGKILFTSNRASWDDIFVMDDDGANVKRLTQMGRCYDAHFTPDGKVVVFSRVMDLYTDVWKMNADGGGLVNLTNSTDNIEDYPVVSPDGQRVAYLFGSPAGFEIYTMKLDGSDKKAITSQNLDLMPTWSPDSQKIAFSSLRGGGWNIWMVNRDGSGLAQVTKFGPERIARSPVFAPNGKQIAFTTIAKGTAWEIWVVNLDGSDAHKVVGTVGNDPNNSTYIASWQQGQFLIGGYQGRWDPYFVAESGGEPVRVPASEKDDKPSDWWLP